VSGVVYKHVICVFGGKNRQKKQAALNTLPVGGITSTERSELMNTFNKKAQGE
jgi:hypothetical protein